MATLQKSFTYGGNSSTAPLDHVNLGFKIQSFEYAIAYQDGKPRITRNYLDVKQYQHLQKLKETTYSLNFPSGILTGETDISVICFWRLLAQLGYSDMSSDLLNDITVSIPVTTVDDSANPVGENVYEGLYSISTTSNQYKEILKRITDSINRSAMLSSNTGIDLGEMEEELASYIRKNTFLLNKKVFSAVFNQFSRILADKNQYALLYIVSSVTDLSSGKPDFTYNADEFKQFMKAAFNIDKVAVINSVARLLKENFDGLFDFQVTVDEIRSIEIKGTLTIVTENSIVATPGDFGYYKLGAGYLIQSPNGSSQVYDLNYDLSVVTTGQVVNNGVQFSFGKITSNFISGNMDIRVSGFDGAVAWENEYHPADPLLQKLDIRVPLRRPSVIDGTDPVTTGDDKSKKLYGKVVGMSGECPVKGLTVVVQATPAGSLVWKIVGAATTDNSGNFSMPYPYGIYQAAQAVVSLTPDKPADITVYTDNEHMVLQTTIADDFLYLLLKDVVCEPAGAEEDCDCKEPKKSNRLPDQNELISSDSYTQDIGGACINLSTPNRTLNEYNHRAIVRTSDPDVANYILTKDPKGNFHLTGGQVKIIRKPVDLGNPIYWQDAPDNHNNLSLYQAVTVATGHILHYKVVTKADGYSLGELIYSLPLAPGQKKQIVTFEQTHTLQGTETQRISQRESLAASLVNDVSITDTIAGNIAQSDRGSSSATTGGAGGGFGLGAIIDSVGISLGISGGVSNANSTASQNSSRALSEFFNEKMRNAITQNAQSYRELNATVVTTVQEGQQYGVTAEVVANHNHCHSLTMMYFEVLRHYAIYQELSYVEECLFIPLLLTEFTRDNIFKWRDVLASHLLPMPSETYLQPYMLVRSGRQHPLIRAFDAIDRIKTNYANVDFPVGAYDDENINFVTGEIYIHTILPRPKSKYDRIKSWPVERRSTWSWSGALIGGILAGPLGAIAGGYLNGDGSLKADAYAVIDEYISVDANFATVTPAQCIRVKKIDDNFFEDGGFDKSQWTAYANLLGKTVTDLLSYYFKDRLISEWEGIFNKDIAPLLFDRVCNNISLNHSPQPFPGIDFSSDIKYKGGDLIVKVNLRGTGSGIKRNQVETLTLAYNNSAGLTTDFVTLTVRNFIIRYSTAHYNGVLYNGYIGDDLLDNTLIYTPENANEKRNPRKEDLYMADKLMVHLNCYLEYYNKVLWRNLDEDRRYMLLDGFNIETYDDFGQSAGSRSLASVVKNELLGIAGNSLIMPVAPGYKIDRTFIVSKPIEGEPAKLDLFEHYKPLTPVPPYRVSIPTRGLFAEAVQGACDACEKVKDNTSQDWEKFKADEPTSINPVTVPVPTVTDWRAAFKELAAPVVNIQNAPAAPAPGAGLAGISDLLGKSDIFRDVTGLTENQKNAMQTYLSNQENAKAFAEMAKEMAMQGHNTEHSDKIQDSINNAKTSGTITDAQASQLTKDHLQQMIDGGQSKKAEQEAQNTKPTLTDAAVKAADAGKPVKASSTNSDGKAESVEIGAGDGVQKVLAEVLGPIPNLKQDNDNACWAFAATIMMSWKNGSALAVADVLKTADNGGTKFLDIYTAEQALPATMKEDFIAALNMVAEKPAEDPSLQEFIEWVRTYGPLWLTTDAETDGGFSPHARILVKITGTGTADGIGTSLDFIDPEDGQQHSQTYNDFMREYKQMVTDNPSPDAFISIVHFSDKIVGEGGSNPMISTGEFGSSLTKYDIAFPWDWKKDAKNLKGEITLVQFLRKSDTFMGMVKALDKIYVSSLDADQIEVIDHFKNGKFVGGKYDGKFMINYPASSNGESKFTPWKNDEETEFGDNMVIEPSVFSKPPSDREMGGWLERIAHEVTHSYRIRVVKPAPSSTTPTIATKVNDRVTDEIEVRKQEQKVVTEARKGGKMSGYTPRVQARDLRNDIVERDIISGVESLTYLEAFTLDEMQKEAIASQTLSDSDKAVYDSAVKAFNLGPINTDAVDWDTHIKIKGPSGNLEAISGYSKLKFMQRIIDNDWKKLLATTNPNREALAQKHVTRFFNGIVSYSPLVP